MTAGPTFQGFGHLQTAMDSARGLGWPEEEEEEEQEDEDGNEEEDDNDNDEQDTQEDGWHRKAKQKPTS